VYMWCNMYYVITSLHYPYLARYCTSLHSPGPAGYLFKMWLHRVIFVRFAVLSTTYANYIKHWDTDQDFGPHLTVFNAWHWLVCHGNWMSYNRVWLIIAALCRELDICSVKVSLFIWHVAVREISWLSNCVTWQVVSLATSAALCQPCD